MPFYKLICHDCGTAFEKQASISDRTEKHIHCPVCDSVQLETDYSAGSAHVQVKKTGEVCPHSAACGCGGCCGGNR